MANLIQAPTSYSFGALNKAVISRVIRKADGSGFEHAVAADELTGAVDSFHNILSLLESPLDRDDSGFHKAAMKGIEDDTDRMMFALKVAPFSSTGSTNRPETILEDGTVIIRAGNTGEDINRPYWLLITRQTDEGGKRRWFYGIGQFSRATKRANKNNVMNEKDFTFFTVDAKGFIAYNPAADTDFTGVTAPTLSGIHAAGTYVKQV